MRTGILIVVAAIVLAACTEDDVGGASGTAEPTAPTTEAPSEATTEIPAVTPSPTPSPTETSTPVPTSTPGAESTPAATLEATPEARETVTGAAPTSFSGGDQLVPTDVVPGRYRSESSSFCSWQRLAGFSGDLDDVIAIEIAQDAPEIVDIAETDAGFTSSGCGQWVPIADADLTPLTTFTDGTYLVGTEIEPGTWLAENSSGDFCSWRRLAGFSGELDDIIAIDITEGRAIVTIAPSDVGFRTVGCGEWTRN